MPRLNLLLGSLLSGLGAFLKLAEAKSKYSTRVDEFATCSYCALRIKMVRTSLSTRDSLRPWCQKYIRPLDSPNRVGAFLTPAFSVFYQPRSPLILCNRFMSNQNENPSTSPSASSCGRRQRESALHMGPRKKPYVLYLETVTCHCIDFTGYGSCISDPLIHHGRHFGRTLHALCNIHSLIGNGILRLIELDENPDAEDSFTTE